ncbi:MAG: NAD(P)/FAD-dependent oxidoreductase [Chitinophagaceae bacterium]|nr:NAD(P)/FAD-dependent oxidoreductase [Chitinophagaceae bacterium]
MAKKIVIIGGGFAGINVAKQVCGNPDFQVTLVDKNNYTFFPPLLYQVATGFLEASNISYPFRKMFQDKKNLSFRMGELLKIIPEQNTVILSTGELTYDYLVIATGTESNYFGMENVHKYAIPMKTVNDAIEMRNYLLQQLEKATIITDKNELSRLLTIVVAGGGPTGVEVSGMLAEMKTSVIRKDYPELRGAGDVSHIYLIDGGAQLLSPMSQKSQENTYTALSDLGVEIILNARVTDYTGDKVILNDGKIIETQNLIWAAGVTSRVFNGIPAEYYGRGRRLKADAYNKVEGSNNIYAVGDTCIQVSDPAFPEGHPQVAQVALQQGKRLGKNLVHLSKQKELIPFRYKDKGSMAIIGRNKAVADLPPNLHFKGFAAWFIWIFIHLISLVNYRNKLTTLLNWMISYFTKDQALRMIIRPSRKTR